MPRRFFRKFALKRERLTQQWYLAPFAHLLNDPRLWSVNRRSVVPAFALGLFIAYMPVPGHIISAALMSMVLRVNIPVAVLASLVSNPLTMGPMYFFGYQFGEWILGLDPRPFEFELSWNWMKNGFVYVWQPLLLGCLLLGTMLSATGYIALDLLWRASFSDYLAKKRKRQSPTQR